MARSEREEQEFLLCFIEATASREQRTKFYSLTHFILASKKKTRLKELSRAGILLFQPAFFAVLPARSRADSLPKISLDKRRRIFCPLFPRVSVLEHLEETRRRQSHFARLGAASHILPGSLPLGTFCPARRADVAPANKNRDGPFKTVPALR